MCNPQTETQYLFDWHLHLDQRKVILLLEKNEYRGNSKKKMYAERNLSTFRGLTTLVFYYNVEVERGK